MVLPASQAEPTPAIPLTPMVHSLTALALVVGIASHAGGKGVHDRGAFRGGNFTFPYGPLSVTAETILHLLRVVLHVAQDVSDTVTLDFVHEFGAAIVQNTNADNIGVAE